MDNKQLMKDLIHGKGAAPSGSRKLALNLPGFEALKKQFGKTSAKQMVDIVLFSAGIYLMYRFGKAMAETLDNQMPTEKNMMEMMK